jgi:hypothetical protein
MKAISNKEKAKEIANIYRDRMLQMNQICDNDWLIMELVNDVLEWKDEQIEKVLEDTYDLRKNVCRSDISFADSTEVIKQLKLKLKGE